MTHLMEPKLKAILDMAFHPTTQHTEAGNAFGKAVMILRGQGRSLADIGLSLAAATSSPDIRTRSLIAKIQLLEGRESSLQSMVTALNGQVEKLTASVRSYDGLMTMVEQLQVEQNKLIAREEGLAARLRETEAALIESRVREARAIAELLCMPSASTDRSAGPTDLPTPTVRARPDAMMAC